ncbi:MAG: hypothetical protein P8M34_09775 [Saprospiraceae bacterium]|nr:hypothetical protein [Saprospiraceae bacterium]
MKKEYFISSPKTKAGLCNRIKSLVSCMQIADRTGKTLIINWLKSDGFNCEFSDLFSNRLLHTNSSKLRIHKIKEAHDNYFITETWRLLPPNIKLENIQNGNHEMIDFQYQETNNTVIETYIPYFQSLQITEFIDRQVNEFAKTFDENTISIAIRTWIDAPNRQHLFDTEKVLKIFEENQLSTFFISSDSEKLINLLSNKYGSKILSYPKRTYTGDRNSTEGIQDALIDLLLLSKNKKLMASANSTFSEVAWWFGKCEANVQII